MTAEAIGRVIADLKTGRIMDSRPGDPDIRNLNVDTKELADWATVIDATPVWRKWITDNVPRHVYEDHRICPPWDNSMICYVNDYGNVNVLSVRAVDVKKYFDAEYDKWDSFAEHTIDWDRVRWIIHIAVYVGGRSNLSNVALQTTGPMHAWRIAVYPDGEIADVSWIMMVEDLAVENWDNCLMVFLDTFNLCNCVNVQAAEPIRPRAEARRVARTGVTVTEIHVKPVSKSYKGIGVPLSRSESPLHSVRGHFAEYGINGKGLLFGKLSGRYWIPQHARGSEINGTVEQKYLVDPSKGEPPEGQASEPGHGDEFGVRPPTGASQAHHEGNAEEDESDEEHDLAQIGAGHDGGEHDPRVPR